MYTSHAAVPLQVPGRCCLDVAECSAYTLRFGISIVPLHPSFQVNNDSYIDMDIMLDCLHGSESCLIVWGPQLLVVPEVMGNDCRISQLFLEFGFMVPRCDQTTRR